MVILAQVSLLSCSFFLYCLTCIKESFITIVTISDEK